MIQNSTKTNSQFSIFNSQLAKAMGRAELAQQYFPFIQPQSAWLKLKALLNEDPELRHLTSIKRRSFLPVEVSLIYKHLGHP